MSTQIYDGHMEFPIIPLPTIDGNPTPIVDFEIANKQWLGTIVIVSRESVPTIGSIIHHFGLQFCVCGIKSVKNIPFQSVNQYQLTLTAELFGTIQSATDNRC